MGNILLYEKKLSVFIYLFIYTIFIEGDTFVYLQPGLLTAFCMLKKSTKILIRLIESDIVR